MNVVQDEVEVQDGTNSGRWELQGSARAPNLRRAPNEGESLSLAVNLHHSRRIIARDRVESQSRERVHSRHASSETRIGGLRIPVRTLGGPSYDCEYQCTHLSSPCTGTANFRIIASC